MLTSDVIYIWTIDCASVCVYLYAYSTLLQSGRGVPSRECAQAVRLCVRVCVYEAVYSMSISGRHQVIQ